MRKFRLAVLFLSVVMAVPSAFAKRPLREIIDEIGSLRDRGRQEGWTFDVGYNEVMDYGQRATGFVPDDKARRHALTLTPRPLLRGAELPAHFDWREEIQGGLTPIKNQKNCGSCWAFGTVAVLESLIKMKEGRDVNISEQQLVSCNKSGYSCNGGWFAHDYHVNPGATEGSNLPYTATNGKCKSGLPADFKLESWAFVKKSSGKTYIEAIKQAMHDHGPVAVTVNATSAFQAYKGGVFNSNGSGPVNHLVNLVGWDEPGGYWILRNSWGESWGEDGYMRIKYGVSRVAEDASFAVYESTSCTPMPEVNAGNDRTITKGGSIFIGAMPLLDTTYHWSPSTGLDDPTSSMPKASPSKTTTYTLSATNSCGTAERSITVTVKPARRAAVKATKRLSRG